jgi:hypothetical protein
MSDVEFLQSILDFTRGLDLTRSGPKTIPQSLYWIANSKVGLSDSPNDEFKKILQDNFVILHRDNDYYIEKDEIRAMCEVLDVLSEEVCHRRLN